MMLREFWLQWTLRKCNKSANYAGFLEAQHFLILFDFEPPTNRAEIDLLEKELIKTGKSVHKLGFVNQKNETKQTVVGRYFKNDLNWIKKPKKHVYSSLPPKLDVLIDWTVMPKSPNDFLVATLKAGLVVGVNRELPCFDVNISNNKAQKNELVIAEIMKYLKIINHE